MFVLKRECTRAMCELKSGSWRSAKYPSTCSGVNWPLYVTVWDDSEQTYMLPAMSGWVAASSSLDFLILNNSRSKSLNGKFLVFSINTCSMRGSVDLADSPISLLSEREMFWSVCECLASHSSRSLYRHLLPVSIGLHPITFIPLCFAWERKISLIAATPASDFGVNTMPDPYES